MTTLTIRKKLIIYLADADDSTVKAIYTLLKDDMQKAEADTLTNEQLEISEEEHQLHISG